MTKPRLVLNGPLPDNLLLEATQPFDLLDLSGADHPHTSVREGQGIRAMLTSPGRGAGPDLLDALPDLELIVLTGAGTDKVDLEAASRRGIRVLTTGGMFAEDVADTGLLLMLAAIRKLMISDRYVRSGDWAAHGPMPLTQSANRRRVGILGFGHIGQAIARRLQAMNSDIRYCTRTPVSDVPFDHEPDLLALATWADVLILALPGGPKTAGIVTCDILDALGPEGTLVNVARGSVVDEEALISALAHGRLGAAGLDVFASEPDPDSRFLALENVVLMPHCGSATTTGRASAAAEALRLVTDHLLPA